jgi:hypothetical protein
MYIKNKTYVFVSLVVFVYSVVHTEINDDGFKSKPSMSFVYDEKAGMYVLQRTKKVNMAMKAAIVAEFGLSAALLIDCSRESKSKESLCAALFGVVAIGVGYSLIQDILDEWYTHKKEQPR